MKAYTFDGRNLNYASERQPAIVYTKSTPFPCDRCWQEFREPDDGNMIWDEEFKIWMCGECQRETIERY